MLSDAKTLAKALLYKTYSPTLRENSWGVGYIFHTERPHEARGWDRLVSFCMRYHEITGARALCALISPANPRLRGHTERLGEAFMRDQFMRLGEVATLGYHGHYWYQGIHDEFHGMRYAQFHTPSFLTQIEDDLSWFDAHDLAIEPFYSAGWWTMRPAVLDELIRRGFTTDYSFSYSPWFRNAFSYKLMIERSIPAARPFRLRTEHGQIGCIQNLIGCHNTPYVEDFLRNLGRLPLATTGDLVGVFNSHDYDLSPDNTLRVIDDLAARDHVSFLSHAQLASQYADNASVIDLRTVAR